MLTEIKLKLLQEEFIKQIKDSYTLNLSLILLEKFAKLQQENEILRKQSLRKRKEDYNIYDICELMYYCDEFDYVNVIMVDNNIIRFDDLDKFVDWYLSLREKEEV